MHAQTRRQREVFNLIAQYIDANGYRPSYQTIARKLGLSSRAGIARIVQDLESQGLLTRHREEGHFSIEMASGAAPVSIQWLDVPDEYKPREPWENLPVPLPEFMLGGHEPSVMRAFRVRDDAMADDNICEDDIALIKLNDFPRYRETIVAVVNKKQAVLRKYHRAGAEIELRPAGDQGKIISVAANAVKILGSYCGLIRPAV